MFKSCPQCGDQFKTYRSAAIYCTKACQNASQIKRDTFTCGHCGESFTRPRGVIKHEATVRYCNRVCHAAAKRAAARQVTCPTCGTRHTPHNSAIRYCSSGCRRVSRLRRTLRPCRHCGAPTERRPSEGDRQYCSRSCYLAHTVGPQHPNWRGGKWLKHGRRWDEIRLAIVDRDKVCQWCGAERSPSGRELDVHHIDGRRNYSIVDLANDAANLVALCAPCHTRLEQWITHGRTADLPTRLRPPA